MIEKFIAAWKAARRWRFRSAQTGKFVTRQAAEADPAHTVKERV